jgi:hypothetical protein
LTFLTEKVAKLKQHGLNTCNGKGVFDLDPRNAACAKQQSQTLDFGGLGWDVVALTHIDFTCLYPNKP